MLQYVGPVAWSCISNDIKNVTVTYGLSYRVKLGLLCVVYLYDL